MNAWRTKALRSAGPHCFGNGNRLSSVHRSLATVGANATAVVSASKNSNSGRRSKCRRLSVKASSQEHDVAFDHRFLKVKWHKNGHTAFHNLWLRDHCQCKECMHEDTRQRLVDTFTIPKDIRAKCAFAEADGLRVFWDHNQHESFYPWDWLEMHSYNPRLSPGFEQADRLFWGCGIQNKSPTVPYKEVMNSDNGVRRWVSNIHRYGFSYVDGCPVTPEATEKLLERIAFIRHTHYGGFWDFTSDLSLKDTAYTSIALGAHTDTTYFSDPAGLQMFHLLSHTHGEGGASLLVDGFRAAHILKEESPEAYQVLSDVRVPTHASGNEGISIQPYSSFPVLNHHPVTGELALIRWNNDDRATMDEWTSEQQVEEWYDAARRWAEILRRNSSEYWEQLRPGRPLIFDNWRVLHGRSAFTGKRRLCGGYVNRDDFISRYRMTNWSRSDVLKSI